MRSRLSLIVQGGSKTLLSLAEMTPFTAKRQRAWVLGNGNSTSSNIGPFWL